MRAIVLPFLLLIGLSSVPTVAEANSACGLFRFPVDVIACQDPAVAALHEEMDDLIAKALTETTAAKKNALIVGQDKWLGFRETHCAIPWFTWITQKRMQHFRPCLTKTYKARLVHLAAIATPHVPERLAHLSDVSSPTNEKAYTAYDLGRKYYEDRRWNRAIEEFDRAVQAQSSFPEAYLARGNAYSCWVTKRAR